MKNGTKLLLVCNPRNAVNKYLIEHVLLPLGVDVSIFDMTSMGECRHDAYYQEHNIPIIRIKLPENGLVRRSRIIRKHYLDYKRKQTLRSLDGFDILKFEYASSTTCRMAYAIRKKPAQMIISIWGSDLLRANIWTQRIQRKLLPYMDTCVMANEDMKAVFLSRFGDVFPESKCRIIQFPIPNLFDIPYSTRTSATSSRLNVFVGYNATTAQQHEGILHSLMKCPAQIKDRICIHLPLTYGESKEYIEQVKQEAERLGVPYVTYETFLSPKEMCELNLSADIYIHGIQTDAFSASMMEYLAAGAVMIKGAWLSYSPLDRHGAFYLQADTVEEMASCLERAVLDYDALREKSKVNRNAVFSAVSSVEMIRRQTAELFGIQC